jgi:hypothetical protein
MCQRAGTLDYVVVLHASVLGGPSVGGTSRTGIGGMANTVPGKAAMEDGATISSDLIPRTASEEAPLSPQRGNFLRKVIALQTFDAHARISDRAPNRTKNCTAPRPPGAGNRPA